MSKQQNLPLLLYAYNCSVAFSPDKYQTGEYEADRVCIYIYTHTLPHTYIHVNEVIVTVFIKFLFFLITNSSSLFFIDSCDYINFFENSMVN